MNKEEILSQLTEISKRLDSEVDSFDIDARVEKIQANDAQADSNDIRIKYLTEQLANDNNYIDTTPIQYYNMQLAQANEELRAAQTAVDNNNDEINKIQSVIDTTVAAIENGKVRSSELADKNIALKLAIRRAKNNNRSADVALFEATIAENERQISEIAEAEKKYEATIEEKRQRISSLSNLTESLEEEVNQAKLKVESVSTLREASKNGRIDVARKETDRALLEALKASSAALKQESSNLGYDFARELNVIIADYRDSKIDDSELRTRLTGLKGSLPADFLAEDKNVRDAELASNRAAQEELELQVETLERKLSSDDNYRLSPAFYANTRARISYLNSKITEYDTQLAMIDRENTSALSEIEDYKGLVALYEQELDQIGIQLAENNGVDKELEQELNDKAKLAHSGIREANAELEKLNNLGLENEQIKKQLEERKARTVELIASNQEKIANPNAIDRSKKRLDQIELQKAQAGLTALKNREAFLENSIVVALNNIINSKTITSRLAGASVTEETKENEGTVLPFPVSGSVDIDELNKINSEKEVTEEKENETTGAGAVVNDDEVDELIGAFPMGTSVKTEENPTITDVPEEMAEEFDGLVAETDTSEVRKDLKEKAEKKGLLQKAKETVVKHWRKAVAVLLVAGAIAATLHSCQGPKKYDQTNENQTSITQESDAFDENEDTINDALEEMGVTLDDGTDASLDDLLEDNKTQETKPGNNGQNVGPGAQKNQDPYTETIPGSTEKPAAPVDPDTIKDPNAGVGDNTTVKPVDPNTIVDEHPDQEIELPGPSEDLGDDVEITNPGDGEDVSDDAWENEDPTIDDEFVDDNNNNNENEEEKDDELSSGVTGDEGVSNDAWENEEPTIDDEFVDNANSGETEEKAEELDENTNEQDLTQGDNSNNSNTTSDNQEEDKVAEGTVVANLNEGETLHQGDDHSVTIENGIAVTPDGQDDIIAAEDTLTVEENDNGTWTVTSESDAPTITEDDQVAQDKAAAEASGISYEQYLAEIAAYKAQLEAEKAELEAAATELTGETLEQGGPVK